MLRYLFLSITIRDGENEYSIPTVSKIHASTDQVNNPIFLENVANLLAAQWTGWTPEAFVDRHWEFSDDYRWVWVTKSKWLPDTESYQQLSSYIVESSIDFPAALTLEEGQFISIWTEDEIPTYRNSSGKNIEGVAALMEFYRSGRAVYIAIVSVNDLREKDVYEWCESQGYTEPRCSNGEWTAFPPGGLTAVPIDEFVFG